MHVNSIFNFLFIYINSFNVVFKMLIPYNGELTYADAVSILHAYVNHCDDITSSSVRKYDDILHKPTPELENLLNQSYILASEQY